MKKGEQLSCGQGRRRDTSADFLRDVCQCGLDGGMRAKALTQGGVYLLPHPVVSLTVAARV